jgi:hypothetical protein
MFIFLVVISLIFMIIGQIMWVNGETFKARLFGELFTMSMWVFIITFAFILKPSSKTFAWSLVFVGSVSVLSLIILGIKKYMRLEGKRKDIQDDS